MQRNNDDNTFLAIWGAIVVTLIIVLGCSLISGNSTTNDGPYQDDAGDSTGIEYGR